MFKIYGTIRKASSKGIHRPNMKALPLSTNELWPMWKFFKSRSKVHSQGQSSKFMEPSERPLSWGIHMPNMKALPLSTNELWPMLKFFKSRSKVTVKVKCSKFMDPSERPCHKEYTCQIWKPYLLAQTSYDQCWSFSKVGQRSLSRSNVQNLWNHQKGLVIRNTHAKYESPTS